MAAPSTAAARIPHVRFGKFIAKRYPLGIIPSRIGGRTALADGFGSGLRPREEEEEEDYRRDAEAQRSKEEEEETEEAFDGDYMD
jgi:hypothetical protein